jgi:hypothetical protein
MTEINSQKVKTPCAQMKLREKTSGRFTGISGDCHLLTKTGQKMTVT